MGASKVMTGARALIQIVDPNTSIAETVSIFNNFSYGLALDVKAAEVLGRYSAVELTYTGSEPINISAGAYRIIGAGPFKTGHIPPLGELLLHEYLTISVVDRQTGLVAATFNSVRPSGFSTSLAPKQLEEMTCTYVGLLLDDEDTVNEESNDVAGGPAGLPQSPSDNV